MRAALADYKGVSVNLGRDGVNDEFAAIGEELLQHWASRLLHLAAIQLQPRRCGGFIDVGNDVVVLIHRPVRRTDHLISLAAWQVRREGDIRERKVDNAIARRQGRRLPPKSLLSGLLGLIEATSKANAAAG